MAEFVLFGNPDCHLCELAEALVAHCLADDQFQYQAIADHEQWLREYGMRIPVLKHTESGAELGWPFDLLQLEQFIKPYGSH